jgi:hypothetical protein
MKIHSSVLVLVFGLAVLSILSADGELKAEEYRRTYDVKDFKSIVNRTTADLEIRLGEDWNIEAVGNKRGIQNLKMFNRNGELIIRSKPGFFLCGRIIYRPVLITVCMPRRDLESVMVTGFGNADIIGDLRSDRTVLRTTARGSITAGGDVEYLTLRSSASGSITFAGYCRELELNLSSSGDAKIEIHADRLKAKTSASGNIYISGEARNSQIRLTSRGRFVGSDFSSDYANVGISASGDAELRIENEVQANLTARGNLYYWGDPQIGEIQTSGRGRLVSRN